QPTAERGRALAHADQPETRAGRRTLRARAVVDDLDAEPVRPVADPDPRGRWPGVSGDVGERLLHDPVGGAVDLAREVARLALDGGGHRHAGRARLLEQPGQVVEAPAGPVVVAVAAQHVERLAQLPRGVAGRLLDREQRLGHLLAALARQVRGDAG